MHQKVIFSTVAQSLAPGALAEPTSEAGLASRGALQTVASGGIGVVIVGTESKAGIVEVVVVDRTVGGSAVLGRDRTGQTVGSAGLAEERNGRRYVFAGRTGLGAGGGANCQVVDRSRRVGTGRALGEFPSETDSASGLAGLASVRGSISPLSGQTGHHALPSRTRHEQVNSLGR